MYNVYCDKTMDNIHYYLDYTKFNTGKESLTSFECKEVDVSKVGTSWSMDCIKARIYNCPCFIRVASINTSSENVHTLNLVKTARTVVYIVLKDFEVVEKVKKYGSYVREQNGYIEVLMHVELFAVMLKNKVIQVDSILLPIAKNFVVFGMLQFNDVLNLRSRYETDISKIYSYAVEEEWSRGRLRDLEISLSKINEVDNKFTEILGGFV